MQAEGEIKITEAFLGIRENYSIIGLLLSVIFICLAVFDELFFVYLNSWSLYDFSKLENKLFSIIHFQ